MYLVEHAKLIEELAPSEARRLRFQYEMSHHIPTVVLLYLEELEHKIKSFSRKNK